MGNGSVDIQIMRYVSLHPGSSFSDIMRTLSLHESTLRYHLEKFERRGIMASKKIGRRRCYFPLSNTLESIGSKYNEKLHQRRILHMIQQKPGITTKELSRDLSLSVKNVNSILNSLSRKGMIRNLKFFTCSSVVIC